MRLWRDAAHIIREIAPDFIPKISVILGSGLSALVDAMEDKKSIPYDDLPGFPRLTVEGHPGRLSLGLIKNVPVACFEGRCHFYEGYSHLNENAPTLAMITPLRTMKILGGETIIITNSAGSLREETPTGSLVAIKDHINFTGQNPLIGIFRDMDFGSFFVGMEDAYDPHLRKLLQTSAEKINIPLTEGVYIGVLGPSFETPAEIKAFKSWGADLVGMSTIPEVIVARQAGLKVVGISVVTNMAAGMSDEKISHEGTLRGASRGIDHLIALISEFIGQY